MLHDRFIEVPYRERLELVEFEQSDEHGVADRVPRMGVALLPIDERQPWLLVRRAISPRSRRIPQRARSPSGDSTAGHQPTAGVQLSALAIARSITVSNSSRCATVRPVTRPRCHPARAGRAVPGSPACILPARDGSPASGRSSLRVGHSSSAPCSSTPPLPRATKRSSRAALLTPGAAGMAGAGAAPADRGRRATPDERREGDYMSWFFVGLPGNLVAFELVSAGSHATYLFRIVPRPTSRAAARRSHRPAGAGRLRHL